MILGGNVEKLLGINENQYEYQIAFKISAK